LHALSGGQQFSLGSLAYSAQLDQLVIDLAQPRQQHGLLVLGHLSPQLRVLRLRHQLRAHRVQLVNLPHQHFVPLDHRAKVGFVVWAHKSTFPNNEKNEAMATISNKHGLQ
jgi:macrodomain Ter protein organizer (MatP/YcbG family)